MAEPTAELDASALPQAQIAGKSRSTFSLVWIVPLVAVLIGGWLAWKTISEKGPEFVIRFKTAEGLEAGKTKIKYKAVDVGTVESIALTPDRGTVLVRARLEKYAENYLVKDSRFWVVRARITGATVQGLGTLLSGAYIGMDVGKSTERTSEFTGLENQPIVTADVPGRHFILKSPTLGSFSLGSPIYFRKIAVGEVESYALDKDGKGVTVRVFIHAPHDQYVNAGTRFWEASGIDVKLSASGVDLETESLASIIIGGIAFQTLDTAATAEPAAQNAEFHLYKDRSTALAHRDAVTLPMAFSFNQSLRGLSIGAPVDFRGVVIGEVTDIRPEYGSGVVHMVAFANVYPERMAGRNIGATRQQLGLSRQQAMDVLVKGGLRAQVRTGSLLTGQLYVAIDFFKDAKPAQVAWNEKPPRFPTVEGAFTGIEENITQITKKIAAMPIEDIGKDTKKALETFNATLKTVDEAIKHLDTKVTPELHDALVDLRNSLAKVDGLLAQDAPLQEDLRNALREVSRAAASARVLFDYLELHPDSVIRGKPEEKQ
jgi:paraquat-inducible protein B